MPLLCHILLALLMLTASASGANILMTPLACNSHVVYFGQLGVGLIGQGHSVTMVIPTNTKVPKFIQDEGIKVYQYQVNYFYCYCLKISWQGKLEHIICVNY